MPKASARPKKAVNAAGSAVHKGGVDFNAQMVMVSALTAAVVTVVLLSLWFFTFGFSGLY